MRKALTLGLLLGALAFQLLGAPTLVLYPQGLALVEESRTVNLENEGTLVFDHLPHGLLLDSFTVEGVDVLAVRPVLPSSLTPDGLVDEIVEVTSGGATVRGRLLSFDGDVLVLATESGLVILSGYQRIVAPLPDREAVEVKYVAGAAGQRELTLRYLTRGISWQASYRALLSGDTLALVGLAELTNLTGIEFPGAQVELIAGEVYAPSGELADVRALAYAPPPEAGPSQAFEYHRYALPGPVDIGQGTVVVPYVAAVFPCQQIYRFQGGAVETVLRFVNTALPLPAGEVWVYDEGGSLFVGASSIGHTPVGEEVELTVGAAFDLTGERTRVSHARLGEDLNRDTYRIVIRSAKDETVGVEVVETLPGTWTITQSSLPYEKVDAQTVLFRLEVPAEGEAELRYTVEWRY